MHWFDLFRENNVFSEADSNDAGSSTRYEAMLCEEYQGRHMCCE